MKQLVLTGRELPIISQTSAIVVGGSFAGISAAIELANAGISVTLIEPRTYLGREITATHRYWLRTQKAELHELLAGCLNTGKVGAQVVKGAGVPEEIALHPDFVKRYLEDVLIEAKIKLIYASLPVQTLRDEKGVKGIVIANKSGMQVVEGRILLDASETAITANRNQNSESMGEKSRYSRVLEFDGVSDETMESLASITLPPELKVADNELTLHRGCRGAGHVLVEFHLELPCGNNLKASQERESLARHKSMEIAAFLVNHKKEFKNALLAAAAHELYGPLASETLTNNLEQSLVETAPIEGIWYASHYGAVSPNQIQWLDAALSADAGQKLAQSIMTQLQSGVCVPIKHRSSDIQTIETSSSLSDKIYEIRTATSFQQGKPYLCVGIPEFTIPVYRKVDVLVAGGGTSGATASITAAREGADTLVLELNSGLGGTGTLGGVDSYWFGRRVGFAEGITGLVDQVHNSLNYKGHKWNIEAKMYALLKEAESVHADLLFNSILFGTVMESNQVKGVVAATRWGAYAFLSEVLLDATGDGDAAAFAGASYLYGSERDHTVMWYSLAQFEKPGRTKNNFTSMVDVSNIEDYTRAIVAGRRRGDSPFEHGVYVATRESRHIKGDVIMTLSDQLLHRLWPDVINIHFSNHDIKGVSGADWVNIGSIPPNLLIEIPYRMLLPKGLEGILVIGKALSATHDALPAIRMQSDLENLGGVAALAAIQSIREKVVPRDIQIDSLQIRLVEAGILPKDTPGRQLEPIVYNEQEMEELVNSLTGEVPLYHYSNMRMNEVFTDKIPFAEICSLGPRIVPFLIAAMERVTGSKKVQLAQALAMLGASEGVPVLLNEIDRLLEEKPELPSRRDDFMYVQLPPDHGAMPDVAYILYSLGLTMDERSLPVWEQIVNRLDPSKDDFKDMLKGTFYYVHAICSGAERLGNPKAIPLLQKLHSYAPLHGNICKEGIQPDYFEERRSMLELTIARALARCGSIDGYNVLIPYLGDVRSLLAEHAHEELKNITGHDYGRNELQWQEWLQSVQMSLQPHPYRKHLDRINNSEVLLRKQQ